LVYLSSMARAHHCPRLFPYTTLFRSERRKPFAFEFREPELDGDPPGLLLLQPVRVDPGERPHQGGLAVVDVAGGAEDVAPAGHGDRKSTRLNSSHVKISYAVFCLKKK